MSKKGKLIARLCSLPAPKDFPWNDLITLMTRAGFANECSGGSHYVFEHESGYRFTVSKTHPSGVLKAYQVAAAREALRVVGALEETENGG